MCRELIEAASFSIREHLKATSELAVAVQKSVPEDELITLWQHLEDCSLTRENAVTMYDRHVASHTVKTMAAGSVLSE